jgi:ABC-type Na+ efflux pump permease subunit
LISAVRLCHNLAMRTKDKSDGQRRPSFIEAARQAQIIKCATETIATLGAGLSAMVKRQEEVQNATMFPGMLFISGWLLVYLGVYSPNATWTKVLSYIPFWTPTLMLLRIALGTVAWWEIVVTIALMLVAILACTWFAARLYRYGVLMYGQRPGLAQLVKLVRMNERQTAQPRSS